MDSPEKITQGKITAGLIDNLLISSIGLHIGRRREAHHISNGELCTYQEDASQIV
jgi:hypothetical protein